MPLSPCPSLLTATMATCSTPDKDSIRIGDGTSVLRVSIGAIEQVATAPQGGSRAASAGAGAGDGAGPAGRVRATKAGKRVGADDSEDGDALLVPVPEMTAETRRNVGKLAAKAAEAAKISVRNARKKGMDAIKKAQMTEDERKRAEKALQGRHDEHVKRASELAAKKEKQIAGEA